MSDATAIDRDHDAPPGALAMLGLVAALVTLLCERVLPRWRGCPVTGAALLEVQHAMVLLAAVAWDELDAPETRAGAWRMEAAALRMRDAMRALMATIESRPALRRRRWTVAPRAPRREGGGARPLRGFAATWAPLARARDGPGPEPP